MDSANVKKKHKEAEKNNKEGENLIFLISQPRAGSTLLQRILNGHPQIHTVAEPWIMLHPVYALKQEAVATEYVSSLAREALDDFLKDIPEGRELYIKALREMALVLYNRMRELSAKPFFLDKTPRYYYIIPELYHIFPKANFVILLRNPMAVLSSLLVTCMKNRPDLLLKDAHYSDATKGPRYLINGIKQLKEDAIVVHYENLVAKPKDVVQHLCDRIGIPFYEDMLEYGLRKAPKGRFGDPVGVHKHKRPVSDYIDKWVQNLTSANLVDFAREYLSTLGPDVFAQMGYSYQETKNKLESKAVQDRVEEVGLVPSLPQPCESNRTKRGKFIRETVSSSDKYLISAIVSTYNSERFIRGCLEDLENQTIADKLEIVVVNSGSQQNEQAIVTEFQQKYDNIKYIETNERETLYRAWNRGIEAASGKYITNANADDRHCPEMFERLATELDANESIAVVYSQFYITTVENQTWQTTTSRKVATWVCPYSRERLLEKNITGPQPMWRRSLHDEYGLFDETFRVCGDYEFFLRVSQTHDFLFIPEPLGLYLFSYDSLERTAGTRDEEDRRIWNIYRNNQDTIIRRPLRPHDDAIYAVTGSCGAGKHHVSQRCAVPSITIVTVNFNTPDFTKLCVSKIFELSDLPFEMIVVDNGSTDRSVEYLKSERRVKLLQLPRNIGHGPALDHAMMHVSSKYVVVIDSDAHPIHEQWLSRLIEPLNEEVLAAGVHHHRNYVHPACMAMETETFRKYKLTFKPNWPTDGDIKKLGVTHWDVGEYISVEILRQGKRLHYFELSNKPEVSIVGSEYGGIVYHHFYGTRTVTEPSRDTFDGIRRHDIVSAKNRHFAAEASCRSPKLSVVLTAHNRPELLEKTLAGFSNQTVPKEAFEVIVVDDGSEPALKETAEKFRSKINIVYIYQENAGLAAARNNGIKAAKGQIVLFSDDDDVPGPELVAEHLRSHRENPDERIAVLGHLDWHENLQVTPLMHYITHEGGQYLGYDSMQHGQLYNVWKWWGGLISAKMSLLKSVEGPFDSRLHFGYEDTELACRLLNRDIKVLYNARARSYILRPIDFESFCQRRYMQGQALHYVASVHPNIIIPRYHLQNATNRYYSEYAPFLEEWSSKVIRFENLLRSKPELQGHQSDGFLKVLCTVYSVCFEGYWLKGYVEQMETVGGRKVSLSEPVGRRHTESRDKLELDCSRPSMPSVTGPLRITFLNTNTPGFDISSANLRIYHILKILAAAGHKIDHLYFSRYEDDERYTAAFDGAVNFIKVRGTISSFSDYLRFNRLGRLDCVWITNLWSVDYLDFAVQLTRWLKRNRPQTKVIIDTMDFHYKKSMRRFNVSQDGQDLLKAKQFLEVEKKLYPLADAVLAVSEVEKRDILEHVGSDCNVGVVPNIHRILAQGPDLRQRKHICYIGSFRISHNVDAVRWFLQEVFALIVQKAPDAEFHILGFANEELRDKLEAIPHVKVTGYVEDAESAVANYRLFVCPMTYGAGMKGKLGVAAAAGTPIVTTTIGAEGFDFVDGQNCFIADEPRDFANKCLRLLSEDSLWSRFSAKAKDMVAEKFSIKAVSAKIHALLQRVTTVTDVHEATADSAEVPARPDYVVAGQVEAQPKVSIITPCYNSGKFLRECLDSMRNQTMHQWELFLLDDGSTDGTKDIIEEYCRTDKRIRPYYFESNEGPYVRRNFAIQRANSDFIVIQDADDIMSPAKLQILYDEIRKDQQLGVVGSFFQTCLGEFKGSEYADSIELATTHDRIMEQYASALYICWHGSTIIRKSLFETIGLYDENPFGSDTLWLAKAAEYARYSNEIRFKNIPVYLTVKREHASSQQGRLPIVDPRSRRARFRIFWLHKLLKIREKLQKNPAVDIKTELRNCKCNDYMNRYSSFFEQWESEPLGDNVIGQLLNTAVILFNNDRYVSCITTLNGMEVSLGDMAKRFKNYDLLRAMAFFAIDMKEQSLTYLNREIQNHNNPAAKQFIYDYFEGPRSPKRLQSGSVEQQSQIDVQKWCAEYSDLYELQMIDTRIVPDAVG